MDVINWDQSMLVGVAQIDAQHGLLTDLINQLHQAYMQGQDKQLIAPIINSLHDYAQVHFATEEALMRRFEDSYGELTIHLQLHSQFFSRIVDFLLAYVSDPDGELTPELLDFLVDWWKTHVIGIDARFGQFLNQHGVM
ncbi:bacteriohemerythrin [Megalodesulfovibrio paquesii]